MGQIIGMGSFQHSWILEDTPALGDRHTSFSAPVLLKGLAIGYSYMKTPLQLDKLKTVAKINKTNQIILLSIGPCSLDH